MYTYSKLYESVTVPEYVVKGKAFVNPGEIDKTEEWGIRRPQRSFSRKEREVKCRDITKYDFIHLIHDEEFINSFFSPSLREEFRVLGEKSICQSMKTGDLKSIVDDYWNMDNNEEDKPKYKREFAEWIFCKVLKSGKENVFSKKRKRRLELRSIEDLTAEELNFFSFFEGRYIVEKNIMMYVLSFLLQFCGKEESYHTSYGVMELNINLSLINSRWYVLFLEASGRFHEGKSITHQSLYVLPIIFLNNLRRVKVDVSKEFYSKDYRYLQDNLCSVKEIEICARMNCGMNEEKEYDRFLSSVRSSKVLKCSKMKFSVGSMYYTSSRFVRTKYFKKFPVNKHLPNLKHVFFDDLYGKFDVELRTVQILEFVLPSDGKSECPKDVITSSLKVFPCLKEIRFKFCFINNGECLRILDELKDLKKFFCFSTGYIRSPGSYVSERLGFTDVKDCNLQKISNLSNIHISLKCSDALNCLPAYYLVKTNMMAYRELSFGFRRDINETWLRTFKNQFFHMGNLEKLCLSFVSENCVDIFKRINLFHVLGELKNLKSLFLQFVTVWKEDGCRYISTENEKIFDITKNTKLKEVIFKRNVDTEKSLKIVVCTYFDHLENWEFKLNRDQKISFLCSINKIPRNNRVDYFITNKDGKTKVDHVGAYDLDKIRNTADEELDISDIDEPEIMS